MESNQAPPAIGQNVPTDFKQQNPFEYAAPPSEDTRASQAVQASQEVTSQEQPPPVQQPTSPKQPANSGQPTAQEPPSAQDRTQAPADQYVPYSNESALIPGLAKPVKEEVLLEWQAPIRPFKKHNRQVFTTIGVIGLLIGLILFFAGQFLPVAVVFAAVFLIYVLYSTPPGMVIHKLTNYGLRIENNLYYWEEMGRFWFTEKFGQPLLHIEVDRFPNRLTLLLGDLTKEDMELLLGEILLQEVPPPTAYEKAAKWLHEKVPINLES